MLAAETVTVCADEGDPAVAVKVVEVDPALIATVAGIASAALLLVKVISVDVPFVLDRVTVQIVVAPAFTELGEQFTPVSCGGATRFRVNVWFTPFRLAVSSAL